MFILFCLFAITYAQFPSLSLPALLGPHNVGTKILYLPTPKSQSPARDIMISLFYPTQPSINNTKYPFAPAYDPAYAVYLETAVGLPPGLAGSILSQAHLEAPLFNAIARNTPSRIRDCPKDHPNVVLFSPGSGGSRQDYTATLSNLASHGYIVVGVDHPNDTSFISYPDGRVLIAPPVELNETTAAVAVELRVKDLRFVLDSLSRLSSPLPGLKSKLDVSHVGVFGHSLGGAASASAILADKRFIAGSNIDGLLLGPVVNKGIKDSPFLIIASEGHNNTNFPDWNSFWKKSKGEFELEIQVKGSRHGSFSDQAVLYAVLKGSGLIPDLDPTGEIFGTIGGRVLEVQDAYVTSFFDYAFTGKKDKFLKGPSALFPEVIFFPIPK